MKILSIGNSFSEDAHRWLHDIATAQGLDIQTADAVIYGCSLQQHYNSMINNSADYYFQLNGGKSVRMVTMDEALTADNWDIVTVQQASHDSGRPQTYLPYLTEICSRIKALAPKAELYIQETWSYEVDSGHEGFLHYNRDQGEMYRRLHDCYEMAADLIGAKIIPSGTVIQALREETKEFNYRRGGRSLCRDGFHMSFDYGRYAVAATWVAAITGADIRENGFIPKDDTFEDVDPALLKVIRDKIYDMDIHNFHKK